MWGDFWDMFGGVFENRTAIADVDNIDYNY